MEGHLDEFHLARFGGDDAHAFDATVGGVEDLETQSVFFNDFAFLRNAACEFTDQAGDGGGLFFLGTNAEQFVEMIDVHVAGHDVGVITFLHDVGFFVLVANFADNLFHKIFNGDKAGDTAIFVDHDSDTNVAFAHLTQKVAAEFAFRDEVDVFAHERLDGTTAGFGVRNLQDILRVDDADDVVDGVAIDGHTREGPRAERFYELLDTGAHWDGEHLGARLHGFANGFSAELDD